MRDHVVEVTERFRQLAQVSRYKRDVGEPQLGGGLPRRRDGARRKIATDELAIGQACRHRQQIGAVAAAELEDAAGRHAWRCKTVQRGDDGHAIGVRERVRLPLVRDGVVLLGQRRVSRAVARVHSRKMLAGGMRQRDRRRHRSMAIVFQRGGRVRKRRATAR